MSIPGPSTERLAYIINDSTSETIHLAHQSFETSGNYIHQEFGTIQTGGSITLQIIINKPLFRINIYLLLYKRS